jgi:hypothetical protein
MIHEIEQSSKYLDSRRNVHEETEVQHRIQNAENSTSYITKGKTEGDTMQKY